MIPADPPNIVLLVADDVGVDRIPAYGVGSDLPAMPNLDKLADDGVRFTRAWGEPLCSPARAAIQTGRNPYRTGIGGAIAADGYRWLLPSEVTLPELLQWAPRPYATTYVGKWHLSSRNLPGDGWLLHPLDSGWGAFAGSMAGLDADNASDGLPQTWTDWERVHDGAPGRVDRYVTAVNATEAADAVRALPEPFLVEVGFLAAHAPYTFPPEDLWAGDRSGGPNELRRASNAMLEVMDDAIGEIRDALGDRAARTVVIFTADNGTANEVISRPFRFGEGKGTVYEGGLRVPLVVAGPGVAAGETCDHLVQHTDLFATIAELSGAPLPDGVPLDSVSFAPALADPTLPSARSLAYAERFDARSYDMAIRDDRYKLVVTRRAGEVVSELYDVGHGWDDGPNLIPLRLTPVERERMARLRAALPDAGRPGP